jgi:putative SOS response-associated peptidase YedK
MCGRYTISHSTEEILERFNVLKEIFELTPNYNVAPSHMVPVVLNQTNESNQTIRVLQIVKWGLVPFWVRDTRSHKPFINARVETVIEKPSFKSSLAKKRCIIPADGFYEWKTVEGKKQPIRIRLPGDQLFGFAGLYDDWQSADGSVNLRTCAIITVPGNEAMSEIHGRMPAILTPEGESIWLDPEQKDTKILAQYLEPYKGEIETFAVSPIVNSVKNNSKECTLAIANSS